MQRSAVTGGARSFFAEHGWLVIRGGVDAARLTAARRVYDELMAPYLRAPEAPAGAPLWQLAGTERARPVVIDLLRRSGRGRARRAELLGGDDVRLLQDTFLLKRRGGGGRIALHQDYSYTGSPGITPHARRAIRARDRGATERPACGSSTAVTTGG